MQLLISKQNIVRRIKGLDCSLHQRFFFITENDDAMENGLNTIVIILSYSPFYGNILSDQYLSD